MTQQSQQAKPVMSTMWGESPRWRRFVDFYRIDESEFGTVADHRRLFGLARGKEVLILHGAVSLRTHRYRDLVFAALLKLRPGQRPRVLITDATWEPRSDSMARLTKLPAEWFGLGIRIMIRLIDGPHVRYGVLSSDEVRTFPQTWGVDPDRVVFTPFPATIEADTPTRVGDYLFAGGNSLRDYDLLERALTPDGPPTRVAATWSPSRPLPHVQAGPVPHEEFVDLLAGCRAAVVPLRETVRSAGQQSYLNAMLLGKPVIVTEAPGVRDYIEHGVTGIVVPRDAGALRAAIDDVMDPERTEYYAQIGERARQWVLENATGDIYKDRVLLGAVGIPADR